MTLAAGAKLISSMTTAAGTKVTKILESTPAREGFGRLMKRIEYAPNSKMAGFGIDEVVIRQAGDKGKHIMAFHKGDCVAMGLTKPASEHISSVIPQLKEIITSMKFLQGRKYKIN